MIDLDAGLVLMAVWLASFVLARFVSWRLQVRKGQREYSERFRLQWEHAQREVLEAQRKARNK